MKKAVIFDLDGVVVSTDEFHYLAWKHMAEEQGIYFDREINQRLRGVSRAESLEIILERAIKVYDTTQKLAMMEQKNSIYKKLLQKINVNDILPGVVELLEELKKRGIQTAIGSSSKNAAFILKLIGLDHLFDALADGNGIKYSKPDPEVFFLAASLLGLPIEDCVVIEDAHAGIDAAIAAGAKAVAVGYASNYDKAAFTYKNLSEANLDEILA